MLAIIKNNLICLTKFKRKGVEVLSPDLHVKIGRLQNDSRF